MTEKTNPMYIAIVLIAALAAALAGYAFGILRSRRAANAETARLAAELAAATTARAAAEARLDTERRYAAEAEAARAEAEKRRTEALRTEFRAIAAEAQAAQARTLRTEHLQTLETLLSPLGKDLTAFREQFIKGHADIDRHIKDLVEQTRSVGREAEDLARALRGNTKMQGNWGEAVLKNILEAAGLTPGRDFSIQEQTHDDEGRRLIPDVVVHLPQERAVIIDSKVSLTAFTAAMAADEGTTERARLLKEHVESVRRHVVELSAKDYTKVVRGSIGYVLMFIPGEAAYLAAVTADATLTTYAYAQRVIILNPTNLLMALQLAYNLWQSEIQSRSVKEIYLSAEKLYKKFSTFATNFTAIGKGIATLTKTYDDARKQLTDGRGNVIRQLEEWKKKGLTTTSQIPQVLLDEAGEDDEDEETLFR